VLTCGSFSFSPFQSLALLAIGCRCIDNGRCGSVLCGGCLSGVVVVSVCGGWMCEVGASSVGGECRGALNKA
jgi:hypothetical protein